MHALHRREDARIEFLAQWSRRLVGHTVRAAAQIGGAHGHRDVVPAVPLRVMSSMAMSVLVRRMGLRGDVAGLPSQAELLAADAQRRAAFGEAVRQLAEEGVFGGLPPPTGLISIVSRRVWGLAV